MKVISFLFLLFLATVSAPLEAEEKALSLTSDLVEYNGRKMHLTGKSVIEHDLGKIEANSILLIPDETCKKLKASYLELNDDVRIKIKDGGNISSEKGEFDFIKLIGKFGGNSLKPHVVYHEYVGGSATAPAQLLEVKSLNMTAYLKNEKKLQLDQLILEKELLINYNNFYFIEAEFGCYQKHEEKNGSSHLDGIVIITSPIKKESQLYSKEGDRVFSSKINIDTVKREIELESPHGILSNCLKDVKKTELNFSSEVMTWSELENLLTLKSNVSLNYKGIGNLTNPEEIKVYRHFQDEKQQIKSISAKGHTVLNYLSSEDTDSHLLETFGSFILDHQKLVANIFSPLALDGAVLDGKQIHFSGSIGDVYADEATIVYQEKDKKITPLKLILKGNVWLLKQENKEERCLQFALSDSVDYDMISKEMIFKSIDKNRVLFFDKANNLQISAPSVVIKKDSQTDKNAVQGVGDVRFSFIDKEFERLQKRFEELE